MTNSRITLEPRQAPYRHDELRRLLDPRSIALIGSSPRKGTFGQRVLANLGAYGGEIFHVNARYDAIDGQACYPSIAALPRVPDCAVITVGRDHAGDLIEECAAAGVGGAIVFASGYAETGAEAGRIEQERLASIARHSALRIVGPNALGIINFASGAGLSFQPSPPTMPLARHSIGLISQSGALGISLTQAAHRGVSFSHMLTSGNSCDVDVADYVSFLADDPACGVIACAFEGVANPSRLVEAARRAWAVDKPLVIYKMAVSEKGSAAAMSHSGTFAGSHASYGAALRAAGAIVVDSLDALVEVAAFFGKAGAPREEGAVVLATSGGAAIMAADAAQAHDVALPPLGGATYDVLKARVPDYGSVANPCDVTAQIVNDPQMFADCMGALFADPAFGVIVTPHVLAQEFAVPRIAVLNNLAGRSGKIACNVWVSQWLEGPGARETEMSANVALFYSMDRCFATLKQWHGRAAQRKEQAAGPRVSPQGAIAAAQALLAGCEGVVTERRSKEIFAAYGIPVAADFPVDSAEAAAEVAARLGTAVVLKGEAPGVAHKSEAGLVKLGLSGPAAIGQAFGTLRERLDALAPGGNAPIILQPMIPQGVEIMVGGTVDDQFGPLLVVGLGGVFVELMRDTVVEPAPVSRGTALRMLERLRGTAILDGFRHLPRVDRARLADVICRFSELLADQRNLIGEVDVNPLICSGETIIAVDGMIKRRAQDR